MDRTLRALEVPALKIVDHCTPSPLTTFGQKGSGEAGYLGAPAAIGNAVNDALEPLGVSIERLPMSHPAIWERIAAAGDVAPATRKAHKP
jgi:2-furoyl-CoA dehydrogenase large subunit